MKLMFEYMNFKEDKETTSRTSADTVPKSLTSPKITTHMIFGA